MVKLVNGIVELYRKAATSIPPDIEEGLKSALAEEKDEEARETIKGLLEDLKLARDKQRPVCIETGVPVFNVKVPSGLNQDEIRDIIIKATRIATEKVPLGQNAVDPVTGLNTGDGTGDGIPEIHMEESQSGTLTIDLMLMETGCGSQGTLYSLPDQALEAGRDLEGVRKCVLDAVEKASGKGCPPYSIGVGIGATREQATRLSREQLKRKLTDKNPLEPLAGLEEKLRGEINSASGGERNILALGVKIGAHHRHPDAYFVDVLFSCWANRRARLIW